MREGTRFITGKGTLSLPERSIKLGEEAPIKKQEEKQPTAKKIVHGYKIVQLKNFFVAEDNKSLWQTIFSTLAVGEGFEIHKKDFSKAKNAVSKYNISSKKYWKTERKFMLQLNVNVHGVPRKDVGRIGRIK